MSSRKKLLHAGLGILTASLRRLRWLEPGGPAGAGSRGC